jgi:hypothetical protein
MNSSLIASLACFLLTAPALAAPAPAPSPPAPSSPAPPPSERALVHLDLEVATSEPGLPPSTTTFALNLEENRTSNIMIGDNVPLAGSGGAAGAPMRQNVGLRVGADFRMRGTDLVLDVDAELSAPASGGGIHTIKASDSSLVTPGKKAYLLAIVHGSARTVISATATRL